MSCPPTGAGPCLQVLSSGGEGERGRVRCVRSDEDGWSWVVDAGRDFLKRVDWESKEVAKGKNKRRSRHRKTQDDGRNGVERREGRKESCELVPKEDLMKSRRAQPQTAISPLLFFRVSRKIPRPAIRDDSLTDRTLRL